MIRWYGLGRGADADKAQDGGVSQPLSSQVIKRHITRIPQSDNLGVFGGMLAIWYRPVNPESTEFAPTISCRTHLKLAEESELV